MVPPYLTDQERAERVAILVATEIARIVDDLEDRQQFLLDLWGRHRERGPFLDTIFSRFSSLTFRELALLEPDLILKVQEFYRELEDFRMYLLFTEAMPTTMGEAYRWQLRRLKAYAEQAIDALGGEPERPVLEFPEEEDDGGNEAPLLHLAALADEASEEVAAGPDAAPDTDDDDEPDE
ncbi:MAG: hypothetical protein H6737_04200 [Alphaproteobacteria bacterium]|nr:hypothetical protein [Alphaproteobacteria bacterium]